MVRTLFSTTKLGEQLTKSTCRGYSSAGVKWDPLEQNQTPFTELQVKVRSFHQLSLPPPDDPLTLIPPTDMHSLARSLRHVLADIIRSRRRDSRKMAAD